jgi:hypothetical protein
MSRRRNHKRVRLPFAHRSERTSFWRPLIGKAVLLFLVVAGLRLLMQPEMPLGRVAFWALLFAIIMAGFDVFRRRRDRAA